MKKLAGFLFYNNGDIFSWSTSALSWNPVRRSRGWPGESVGFEICSLLLHRWYRGMQWPAVSLDLHVPLISIDSNSWIFYEGLNDFCRIHPHLEQLHFLLKNRLKSSRRDRFQLDGDWTLPFLKILTYYCQSLSQSTPIIFLFKELAHIFKRASYYFRYYGSFSGSMLKHRTASYWFHRIPSRPKLTTSCPPSGFDT